MHLSTHAHTHTHKSVHRLLLQKATGKALGRGGFVALALSTCPDAFVSAGEEIFT